MASPFKPPISPPASPNPGATSAPGGTGPTLLQGAKTFTDPQLLEMFTRWKRESFDQRWIYERQWMRNVFYILNRQWIYFDSKRGQWQDKRLARWIPRPVTNILKDGLQTVRANFAAINYGATARPANADNKNVVTASVADDYMPILYTDHQMDAVYNEFDFWMLACGNAWMHTAVNHERKNGMLTIRYETCLTCKGGPFSEVDIKNAGQKCPQCGANTLMPATNPDGSPMEDKRPLPKGITIPLSPFEIAYPLVYERYDLAPYTIRMRWRDKSYYEQNGDLSQYVNQVPWSKSPAERTMQIFKSLPFQNDLGVSAPFFGGGGTNTEAEGVVEYDVWVKPCDDFPDGQVIRFAGDQNPIVIHSEQESLPGPLPYHSGDGNPIFTFHHARYEHVGGRSLGSALIDPGVQKQDQLNQLDSHMLMIIGRMANPVWLEPKGAEVEKFTGEPGLVVKWNPLVAGGNAKPERIPGEGINASVFQYRQIIKDEAQDLMGTYDILKGQKPAGVEAYAALNLLLERGQAKHASAFKERAAVHRAWAGDALSIEQEFGDETKIRARMMPNRSWAFDEFKRADLKGSVEIIIEDGTTTPKTNLGERASIDHLNSLGLIDPTDEDQKRKIFEKFGESELLPEIDAQVQEAWMNMDAFETFLKDPNAIASAAGAGISPLRYKRWYNPAIHRKELIKWALSDRGREVFKGSPAAEGLVDAYLTEIDVALGQAQMGIIDAAGVIIDTKGGQPPPGQGNPALQGGGTGTPGGGKPGAPPNQQGAAGRGSAMGNSNANAGGVAAANPAQPQTVVNQ
jgi:hypothetical protein